MQDRLGQYISIIGRESSETLLKDNFIMGS